MKKDDIVRDVAELANAYLGRGVRIPDIESVAPDDQIRSIEDLLVRYFVLTGIDQERTEFEPSIEQSSPDVIPFVGKLPGRIKRVKITTEPEVEISRGEIQGHVDWQKTVKTRQYRGTQDDTLFAVRQTNEQVESIENQVLATLIHRIHAVIANQFEAARKNEEQYQWLERWIAPDSNLWTTIKRLKYQNPVISRIEVDERPISDTVLQEVKTARSPLYREAAKLLERYQKYSRGEYSESELRQLFNTLFVGPAAKDELFELYWGYKILTPYDERKLETITGTSRELARWAEDGAVYRLQFRSTGSDPPTFHIPLTDMNAELATLDDIFPGGSSYLQRRRKSVNSAADAKEEMLGKSNVERSVWSGEPDLLLTKWDNESEELRGVFVGEVKYTDSNDPSRVADRASEGLEELTEYMELLRDSTGNYLASDDSSIPVSGAVFTPPFEPEKDDLKNIKIVTFGEEVGRLL